MILHDLKLFILGLDEISLENETLSKQRKCVAKAAKEQRKELREEDEDYEPKLTPGYQSSSLQFLVSLFVSVKM